MGRHFLAYFFWPRKRSRQLPGCPRRSSCVAVPEIDEWLRRRVRMCYWKQWRLLALGVGKRQAILTAISSKSYWRLSKTLATQAKDD